jgi:hypothetical protein
MVDLMSPGEFRTPVYSVSADILREEEDIEESDLRDEGMPVVSGARFEQRTEVFEALLGFIADDDKQPSKDLLDIIDFDEGL